MTYRIGSLFSGAGGLDMAVEHVFGGQTVWHSEIDKAASKVLSYQFPYVQNLGDITQINWADVEPVEVLCGGFPCQDVSAAGKRAGIRDGTRSGLWAIFADAIDALRPRYVVIENVRGLLNARAHRNMESDPADMGNGADRPILRAAGAVLGDLADLRYDAQWVTYAAGDVGAPHRRERVFILATAANAAIGRRDTRLTESGRLGGKPVAGAGSDFAAPLDLLTTARAAQGESRNSTVYRRSGPDKHNLECSLADMPMVAKLLPTPRSSDCFGAGQHGDGGMDLRTTISLLPTPKAHDGEFGTPRTSGRPIEKSTHLGTIASLEYTSHWGKYAPAIHRWESLTRPAPAPTEPNKNGNPRLAAQFSEWMMGWPAGWVTDPAIGISRNDQLRIVGNGVCPQQATAALTWLLQIAEVAA